MVITTLMMALSCLVIAILPTYQEIGIAAAWIVTICRIIQGITSMAEVTAAELYVHEISKPPIQYLLVAIVPVFGIVGGVAALGVASIVTSKGFNWRYAFLLGVVVALIGSIARECRHKILVA